MILNNNFEKIKVYNLNNFLFNKKLAFIKINNFYFTWNFKGLLNTYYSLNDTYNIEIDNHKYKIPLGDILAKCKFENAYIWDTINPNRKKIYFDLLDILSCAGLNLNQYCDSIIMQ